MTPTETITILRRYNKWRRGNLEGMPQPDPREIGLAIDAAIEIIESAEEDRALCDKLAGILTRTANVLKGEPKPMRRHGWHDLPDVAQKLQRENTELREALEHPSYEEENRLRAEVDRLRAELSTEKEWVEEYRRQAMQLSAKIEAMEKQEPVAEIGQQYTLLFVGSGPITGVVKRHGLKIGDKLYALPGTQPAPSVPEGFKLVPIEPTPVMIAAAPEAKP